MTQVLLDVVSMDRELTSEYNLRRQSSEWPTAGDITFLHELNRSFRQVSDVLDITASANIFARSWNLYCKSLSGKQLREIATFALGRRVATGIEGVAVHIPGLWEIDYSEMVESRNDN